MNTKLVNIRLPEQLYAEGKELVEIAGYANFQELLKDSLRHSIQEIKKDQAFVNLQKLFGSTKGKERKLFTSEIKNKLTEELVKNIGKQKILFKRA